MLSMPTTNLRYEPSAQDVVQHSKLLIRDFNLTFQFENINRCDFGALDKNADCIISEDLILLREPHFSCSMQIQFANNPQTTPQCLAKYCLLAKVGKGVRFQCKLYVVDQQLNMRHMGTSKLYSNSSDEELVSLPIIEFVPRHATRWNVFAARFATDNVIRFAVQCQISSCELSTRMLLRDTAGSVYSDLEEPGEGEEEQSNCSCLEDSLPEHLSKTRLESNNKSVTFSSDDDSTNSDNSYDVLH